MTTASRPRSSAALTPISDRALNRTTLLRQSLLKRASDDPATAIHRLAGLQAQHANSPYIALWSRLRDFAITELEKAIENRSVVKASAIRNTLHLIAAEHYPAFSTASAVARIANWRPSASRSGVDTEALHRRLLGFAHEPRTIAELEADLETLASDASLNPFVPSGVRHVAFQMASAHGWLVHVPPSGMWDAFGKPRYIDAGVWLPKARRPEPDEALKTTVERYLGAYGPASDADIGRWLGQPRLAPIREAIDSLGERIRRFRGPDGRELVDLEGAPVAHGDEEAPTRFLARWYSVILGCERRDRILPPDLAPAVIKKNADILATFTVDGFVAGTWSVTGKGDATTLEITPIARVSKASRTELSDEAERLVLFIGRDPKEHRVEWARNSEGAQEARASGGSAPPVFPMERARVAMPERKAGATGQIPMSTVDIRSAIHDREGERSAVGRVAEGDQRSAWERAMGDPQQASRHREPAGGPFAVEVRAIPGDIAVPAPGIPGNGARLGFRLGTANRSLGWLGLLGRLEQRRALIQATGGPGPWIEGRNRHHHPADKRRYLHPFKEVRIDLGFGVGDPRTGRTGDDDQGEQGDERRTRDDSGASHV